MQRAMDVTTARRKKQESYNAEHGIVPTTIVKPIRDLLTVPDEEIEEDDGGGPPVLGSKRRAEVPRTVAEAEQRIAELRKKMFEAAKDLDFEAAAKLRDEVLRMEALLLEM
jgi:excinuclease ABC subunit B